MFEKKDSKEVSKITLKRNTNKAIVKSWLESNPEVPAEYGLSLKMETTLSLEKERVPLEAGLDLFL